jgi:hypothetical protein
MSGKCAPAPAGALEQCTDGALNSQCADTDQCVEGTCVDNTCVDA